MTTPPRTPVRVDRLTPAAEEGWHLLLDLAEADPEHWCLLGGQLMYVLAAENGQQLPRSTDDVDVVVDLRARPDVARWVSEWLLERGLRPDIGADDLGHRFVRDANPGPGMVIVDVLAPDNLGPRADLTTTPPARTVEAPGTRQALDRAELIEVTVSGDTGRPERTGRVRRPTVLAALIAKAAATTIPVRANPDRDWQDAALALALINDPIEAKAECSKGDRRRIGLLQPLLDPAHPAWTPLPQESRRSGQLALQLLMQ